MRFDLDALPQIGHQTTGDGTPLMLALAAIDEDPRQPRTEFDPERLQELGYFGPLGIDAAEHELLMGEVMLRPLQDINARFTMGRLALGFRPLLRANQTGVWQHLMAEDISTADSSQGRPVRIIPTTPKIVGGQPTHHRSAVVIG